MLPWDIYQDIKYQVYLLVAVVSNDCTCTENTLAVSPTVRRNRKWINIVFSEAASAVKIKVS